ncbi:hypothetical protein DVH05_004510 [Phytophthora capsici]|nr:hypothetical protein DVH05_004510 [Phytophthora capsici]
MTSTSEKKDADTLDDSSMKQQPVRTHTGATSSAKLTTFYATRISSKSPLELHRRCAETIERCSARLRERQRKMDRLQLLLPIGQSGSSKEDRRRSTSQTRSTPPRPAKRNKHGSGIFEKNSTSPAWSAASSVKQRISHMTPPLANRNGREKIGKSLGATPNTPPSDENEKAATKEVTPATSSRSEDTLELSLTDKSTDSPQKKVTVLSPTWAQRQQDFMAAIEAEADSDRASVDD